MADEDILEYQDNANRVKIDLGASKTLTKAIGEAVCENEVIAKGSVGLIFKKTILIKSSIKGRVSEIDLTSRTLYITRDSGKKTLKSPVSGKLKEVDDKKIVIEFKGEEIKSIKSKGEIFVAEMKKIAAADDEVDSNLITDELEGKIIVGGHFSMSDLNRAMAVGVRGVIATKISDDNFERFGTPKTLTIGKVKNNIFLSMAVIDSANFEKLAKHKGKLNFNGESGIIIIPS